MLPVTVTVFVFIPKDEKLKISPTEALIVYLPSKSVSVPFVVPCTTTLTPGKVVPSNLDVTVPEILFSCACTFNVKTIEKTAISIV